MYIKCHVVSELFYLCMGLGPEANAKLKRTSNVLACKGFAAAYVVNVTKAFTATKQKCEVEQRQQRNQN